MTINAIGHANRARVGHKSIILMFSMSGGLFCIMTLTKNNRETKNKTTRQNHWNLFHSFVCPTFRIRIDDTKRRTMLHLESLFRFFFWSFGGLDLSYSFLLIPSIKTPKFLHYVLFFISFEQLPFRLITLHFSWLELFMHSPLFSFHSLSQTQTIYYPRLGQQSDALTWKKNCVSLKLGTSDRRQMICGADNWCH